MTFSCHQFRALLTIATGILLASLLLGIMGCGGGGGGSDNEVTGTVKFNGKPFAGTIVFVSQKDAKEETKTIIDKDGRYRMPKAPLGAVNVAFQPTARSSSPKDPPPIQIPEKYHQPQTSGQSFEVKKGRQTKDFELTP